MKKLVCLLVLVVAFSANAAKFNKVLGQTFPEVKAKNLISGDAIDLGAELQKETIEGGVVVFTSSRCPVAIAYEGRVNDLVDKYGSKVFFLSLNANSTETAEEFAGYVKEKKLKGNFAMDEGSKVAAKLGAGTTPEAYLLDDKGKIVYHGPIDDSQDAGYIEDHLMADAIDALLSGEAVPEDKREVQSFGCGIKYPEK
jgi:hypothetical protein